VKKEAVNLSGTVVHPFQFTIQKRKD
jgi:hypothetical protein